MKQQKLLSLIRQAIEDYNMIEEGDKLAVGVSGGKDSLALLYAMKILNRFYPKKFELYAITCNVGTALLGKDSFQEVDIALSLIHI